MKKLDMENDYEDFENLLIEMFKKQFNCKKINIEWMD